MNLQSYFTKQTNHLQELSQTWMQEIAVSFPNDLEDKIKQSGVLKRKRGIKSGIDLIKLFLLYAVSSISFRMLALAASALSISHISDTAWRKKLQNSIPLFQTLLQQLLSDLIPSCSPKKEKARNVYLVDASVFRQQGKQQTQQRIHLCYHLGQNRIAQVKVSDIHTAESLSHFSMQKGDIFLADAGYGTAKNYAVSMEQNADVILRITPSHFPIYNQEGQKIELLPLLSQAKKNGCKTIEIKGYIPNKKKRYFTRLIIGQIPEEKAAQARKRKQRKAQKNQYEIKEKTLLYAGYVFLATSLGVEYDKEEVLSLYRSRWQVELLFKRFKQNLKIRTIRVASEQYASAMIYLWLIVWVLVERQVIQAERLLLEQQISRERISQWDLCRFYFIRTAALLCMSWSLCVDPSDIELLATYLQTHKCRRINQNFEFLSCVLPGLIA